MRLIWNDRNCWWKFSNLTPLNSNWGGRACVSWEKIKLKFLKVFQWSSKAEWERVLRAKKFYYSQLWVWEPEWFDLTFISTRPSSQRSRTPDPTQSFVEKQLKTFPTLVNMRDNFHLYTQESHDIFLQSLLVSFLSSLIRLLWIVHIYIFLKVSYFTFNSSEKIRLLEVLIFAITLNCEENYCWRNSF